MRDKNAKKTDREFLSVFSFSGNFFSQNGDNSFISNNHIVCLENNDRAIVIFCVQCLQLV